jgi:hypothetical protein
MARKRDDTVKLVLRLPPPLHRRLTRIAAHNNQSLNSEMIHRLEESFRQREVNQLVLEGIRRARDWSVVGGDEAAMALLILEEQIKELSLRVRAAMPKTEDDGEQK